MDELYRGDEHKHSANGYFIKESPALNNKFIQRAAPQIGMRKGENHFLLGVRDPHEEIARHHPDMLFVHHSVGHVGWSPKTAVYASEYVRNFRLSKVHSKTGNVSAWIWSAVIPHFLDPLEFDPCYEPDEYFLYLGRLAPEKGVQLAIDICASLGEKLCIIGQGDIKQFQLSGNAEYLGFIEDMQKRNSVLRKARAVFVPTVIPEAFGMVVIEAFMSGVPVISSDWGALPEINQQGITGYRCSTFSEYLAAAKNIAGISRKQCRSMAEKHFSDARAGELYQNYFERIHDLHKHGPDSLARHGINPLFMSH
jgi:glycosyltransferase involved in cell wall biosynthesis